MRKLYSAASAAAFLLLTNTAYAAVSFSQQIILAPGWNVVSTPRLLESHSFSVPETLSNFAIYTLDPARLSGWTTMTELGQSEFTPLYGYFINNKSTSTQTLTLNFKASTTPNERLFERKFTKEGWYSFGIANPSYAKTQGGSIVDTNNPDHILNSLLGTTSNYDSVIDFTDASFALNPDSVALKDPWHLAIRSSDVTNITEINTLNDFRETKGYAIYIKSASTSLVGYQNSNIPQCEDGIDNDGDNKIDFPNDFGCTSLNDNSESNAAAGTLSLAKYSAYANQTVIAPQAAYKIGEYKLTTAGNDSFNSTAIGLVLAGSTTTITSLSNIYITVDATTTPSYAVGSSTLYWTGDTGDTFPANSVVTLRVYATLPSTVSSGDTLATKLIVGGVSGNTGDTIMSDVISGQTMTIGTGSLLAALDASTPISALTVGNTLPKVASFKFTAINGSYTIDELTTKVSSINDAQSITGLVFKDGGVPLKTVPLNGVYATATGLSIAVPANGTKVIDVYANLGSIGTGFANSGGNVGVTLSGYETNSGTRTYVNLLGNSFYAYKTKPTITNVALPTTILANGTQTIYQFNLTADAGGTMAWRTVKFNIATSSASVASFNLYDSANQSTVLTNTTCALVGAIVTCTSTQDQEVSGSKTYVLKAIVSGSVVGASISVNAPSSGLGFTSPSSVASVSPSASFVWSDESVAGHSGSTTDWNNDFLVKNLPTDSLTMTK